MLAIVAWCASRMWPVPESRLQAQQRLQARLPADGRNGFALLWTLAFDDLDPGQRDQALVRDVALGGGSARQWRRPSAAGEDHVELQSRPSASCGPTASDCLAQVRADPQRFVDAPLATSSCMRAWTSWPMRITSCRRSGPKAKASSCRCRPMAVIDATSARALAYVQGDIDGALRGVAAGCSWAAGW